MSRPGSFTSSSRESPRSPTIVMSDRQLSACFRRENFSASTRSCPNRATLSGAMPLSRQSYIHCIRGIGLDVRRRIALELSNLADHFGSADSRGTLITLAISHETLANIVGASRQQVTEYLNEFDREKIILREGRRIILNPKNLRKVIESRP